MTNLTAPVQPVQSVQSGDVSSSDGTPSQPTRNNQILLIVVAVASAVPFYWAAIRDARNGFYPTMDVAATVLRSRDVLSTHPPLIGMWSSGSSWAGHEIHFPGAIQLYLLAIPSHVLGNVWGPLLAMATLNAFWILLAGWLVYRRFGTNAALVAFLFLSLFIWSIGSENLIDPRPMEMVTIPFLCFLFAVWVVASGDIDALPALAIVANFLFLDHLVQALQIPVIGLFATVGAVIWVRDAKKQAPPDRAISYRRLRRRLIQAGVITVVMWLPSLIQEFRANPGNLTLLFQATGEHREPVGSVVVGYNATFRLITEPTFWFRGRFASSEFRRGLSTLGVWDVVGGLVLLSVLVALGWLAWRRRDRAVLSAIGVVAVAIPVSIATVIQSPSVWGFLPYLRSLWGLAAFIWFVVAFSTWRLFGEHLRSRISQVAGGGAVVFCVLALSYANYGAATDMSRGPVAKRLNEAAVPKLTGRGKVLVHSAPDFVSQRYFSALLLGLNTAGVHYCVNPFAAEQYGRVHNCGPDAAVTVHVQAGEPSYDPNLELLFETIQISDEQLRVRDEALRVSNEWLASHDQVRLTPNAEKLMDDIDPDLRTEVEAIVAPNDGDLTDRMDSPMFGRLIRLVNGERVSTNTLGTLIDEPDMPVEQMATYFLLSDPEKFPTIRVYEATGD